MKGITYANFKIYVNRYYNTFAGANLRKKLLFLLSRTALYIVLVQTSFVFLFPFIYMVVNSLKGDFHMLDVTSRWIVQNPNWANYQRAISDMNYWETLGNTDYVSVLSAIGQVLSCAFVAYGFSRFKFPGRDIAFSMVLLSIVVPPQILSIPLFMQYSRLGFMDTFLPIIIPSFFGMGLRGGLFIFIFRQYFKGLPVQLEEAARVDGCGVLRTYWSIIFPISKSPMLVTAILSIVWHWNDFVAPMIFLNAPERRLVQIALQMLGMDRFSLFFTDAGIVVNPLGMAGSVLVVLPLIIIYLLLQKQFMRGIESAGLAN